MKLSEWLYQKRIKRYVFAKTLGISTGYMSDLCTGKRLPSMEMAHKIESATGGRVSPRDWQPNGSTYKSKEIASNGR